MITRRQAIGSGLAVSALGSVPATAMAAPAARTVRASILVVDERFEAARALARTLSSTLAPGARAVVLPRDVLELWHQELEPACHTGTLAIAGVTTKRGLFMLQTLAADHRLRLLSRAEHGALVSWVIGPK